jgi:hypothetical protein
MRDGVEGLRDRRIGKVSPRRAPTREPGRSDARRGTSGALPLTKVLQRSEIWVRTADNAFQRDRQSIFLNVSGTQINHERNDRGEPLLLLPV